MRLEDAVRSNFEARFLAVGAFAAAFLLGPCADRLAAQVVKGSISGSIVDQTGAAVPDAQITVTSADTGTVYTATTNAAGAFRVPLLAIGSYNIEVSKTGFRKLALDNVQVNSAADTGLPALKLEVGQVTATVEVSAAPALIQTTQSQISTAVTGQMLQTFPGIGENEGLDFLALQVPGVVMSRDVGFSNSNGVDFGVNGIRGRNNDQQIDGQNNNDNSVAGPYVFVGDTNFVQEYQITTNNFGPEYGRNSGSVVNILTKSGTNNWHGSIYGTESNSSLVTLANTDKAFLGLTSFPHFNDEFAGATIGGPLIKDKAFVFGGFSQELVTGQKQVYSSGNLTPTPTGLGQLAACYPDSTSVEALTKYGPYGISAGDPTPLGAVTTKTLTGASTPDGTCDVDFGGVQRTLSTGDHQYNAVLRFDVNGSKDRVSGRWIYQWLNFFNSDPFVTAAAGYPVNVPSLGTQWGLDWTHNFGTAMVNELRLSYGRETVQFGGNSIGNTVPPTTALETALANIQMPSGYLGFGPATNAPDGRIVNTYQFQDNWTYIKGRHTLKAGVNYTYQRSPNTFLPNINGQYSFSSFSNFAANIPSSVNVASGNANLDFREHDFFAYFGDDFKVKPNLTLNLGLTWSYFGQPANLFHQNDLKLQSSSTPLWNPDLPSSVTIFPQLPSVKSSFGPSIGFAYMPKWGGRLTGGGQGKTVIRGGYRLAYDPPFYNIYLNIASSSPQVLLQTLTGTTAAGIQMPAAPLGPAVRAQLAPFLTYGVSDPRSFNQTGLTPNFGPDNVNSWSFGIQRELTSHAVFEARYVGNHGSNLFQSINLNPDISGVAASFPSQVPSGITPCPASQAVVPTAVGRVNCDLGVFRQRTNTGYSNYNGLQLEFRATNLANQLTLRTAYTWSKTLDNVSEIFATFAGGNSLAFSQDPLNYTSAEYGPSGLNIPQNWTLGYTWNVPAFRGQKGALGHIFGGWGMAGSYIISSGQPYTPVQFGINAFSGGSIDDVAFNTGFAGTYDVVRPYVSNPSAPVSTVGIFAADACNYLGVGCSLAASQLLNFNVANTTGAVQTVSNQAVHFIANAPEANTLFGTPYGTAGRNSLRDYQTNIANVTFFKDNKLGERVGLRFDISFINVFNHPNFFSVDPFIDDAGLASFETGFGLPSLFPGTTSSLGQRQIHFGLRITF
jgi:Carboxypeptidase regulatory-like domain